MIISRDKISELKLVSWKIGEVSEISFYGDMISKLK
jgi:hypothetical protein